MIILKDLIEINYSEKYRIFEKIKSYNISTFDFNYNDIPYYPIIKMILKKYQI